MTMEIERDAFNKFMFEHEDLKPQFGSLSKKTQALLQEQELHGDDEIVKASIALATVRSGDKSNLRASCELASLDPAADLKYARKLLRKYKHAARLDKHQQKLDVFETRVDASVVIAAAPRLRRIRGPRAAAVGYFKIVGPRPESRGGPVSGRWRAKPRTVWSPHRSTRKARCSTRTRARSTS